MASIEIDTEGFSDEIIDILCSVCKRKGRNTEAEKYCVDCNNYVCLPCLKVHDDFLSLAGHKVLDKGQFMTKTYRSALLVPTERCERHSHKPVDMFCQDHDDVGCATCIAIDHRSCCATFYIPEFVKDNEGTPASRDVEAKLDIADISLSKQLDILQLDKQRLHNGRDKALQDISNYRKKINERLDELEKKTNDDTEDKYKEIVSELEELLRVVKERRSAVRVAQDKLRPADDNIAQAFVTVKKGTKVAREAEKYLDDTKAAIHIQDIQIDVDNTIYTILNECNALGSVRLTQPLLQVQNKRTYSVKMYIDRSDCGIVSVCALEDGRIIVSDYHNKRLKCVDGLDFSVQDYIDLPQRPWQVCLVDKYEVAVSLQNRREVQFVSLKGRMTKTRRIKVDIDCFALAYVSNRLYIASSTGGVCVYNTSGTKLREFWKDETGQELFANIYSLSINKDGSMICVADWYKGLIVLGQNGQVVWKFDGNGPMLTNAYGCYITSRGSLLVCGYTSNNILQFELDGKLIGEVHKSGKGDKGCQTVCFNRGMSKMIISREQNELEVYEFY